MSDPAPAPPATLEGWYALHQIVACDWPRWTQLSRDSQRRAVEDLIAWSRAHARPPAGWTVWVRLLTGGGDWMAIHLRPTWEELSDVALSLQRCAFAAFAHVRTSFLSVTEAGFYSATAELARQHAPDSPEFEAAMAARLAREREQPYVRSRLYPDVPEDLRYVTFYPMSKRRLGEDNWYRLDIETRARLMKEHGRTGRRYHGRVLQIITGAIGFDSYEWGVTLFARDPLDLKRLVTDMRYDEVSARYAEFGPFTVGIRVAPDELGRWLGVEAGE